MKNLFVLASSLLSLFSAASAQQDGAEVHLDGTPRLLFRKSTKTSPVVANKAFVVDYDIINTGSASAYKVQVSDRYDASSFDIVNFSTEDGQINAGIESLAPGQGFSFNVTVVPKLFGVYESTRARMRYFNADPSNAESEEQLEDADIVVKSAYSSSMGRIKIVSGDDFEKSKSKQSTLLIAAGAALLIVFVALFGKGHKVEVSETSHRNEKGERKHGVKKHHQK